LGPELQLVFALNHAGQHYVAGPTGLWRVVADGLEAVLGPAACG